MIEKGRLKRNTGRCLQLHRYFLLSMSKSLVYVRVLSLIWLQSRVISELSLSAISLSKVNEPGGFADVATSVKLYEEVFVNMFL